MKGVGSTRRFNKTMLSGAISSALSISLSLGMATVSQADIYDFSYANTGAGDAWFTMLDPTGIQLQNTSNPYYSDPAWGYGLRTQIGGTLSYNTETKNGSVAISPFQFFNGGPAVASDITFTKEAASDLMIGTLKFDWGTDGNGDPNPTINVEIVWDGSGLFAALPLISTVGTIIDRDECATAGIIDGLCATPASNEIKKGKYPIGPVPIAASSFNVDGVVNGVGTPVLGTDDGIGGSPMDNGPFVDFNANFDFGGLTLTSFTDTTPPTIALNAHLDPAGTTSVLLELGVDTYTEPGATCTDAAPVGGTPAVTIGGSVNDGVAGLYTVTYDCMDTSDNPATQVTREVIVCGPGGPCIALTGSNPVTQECAVPYTDAGAVCVDNLDGDIPIGGNGTDPGTFQVDTSGVDVSTISTDTATWTCTDDDSITEVSNRTVEVVDTTPPDITINPALEGGTDTVSIVSSTPENPVTYADQGASATDTCDLAAIGVTTTGTVDVVVPDTGPAVLPYNVRYDAVDASLNVTPTEIRAVSVTRSQPVIALSDGAGGLGGGLVLNTGDTYVEQGMDIIDAQELPGSNLNVTASGGPTSGLTYTIDASAVDTTAPGSYEVIYNVTDSDSNLATQVIRSVQVGVFATDSNFTMLDSSGSVVGGTNDVVFDWDQTENTSESDLNFNMSITSQAPWPFYSFVWTAHSTRAFGPGTYSFDTGCTVAEIQATGCPAGSAAKSGKAITMTVPDGYVGAHILFDWNTSSNIDVVNVWERDGVWDRHGDTGARNKLYDGSAGDPPDPATTWKLVSTDVNGDGVNGSPMVDGPFQGFYANFNAGPGERLPPPPPYTGTAPDTKLGDSLLASFSVWGLFAGLVTLCGLRRVSKKTINNN